MTGALARSGACQETPTSVPLLSWQRDSSTHHCRRLAALVSSWQGCPWTSAKLDLFSCVLGGGEAVCAGGPLPDWAALFARVQACPCRWRARARCGRCSRRPTPSSPARSSAGRWRRGRSSRSGASRAAAAPSTPSLSCSAREPHSPNCTPPPCSISTLRIHYVGLGQSHQ